jgi:hypothetical protein
VGSTFTCQIAVRSVSKGGYSSVLDYYGGVSRSELPVGICSSFGGFGNIYEGHTMLGLLDWYFSLRHAAIVTG